MDEKQIFYPMRLRPFTPKIPIHDIQTTAKEWKPNPEDIIRDDDLDARKLKSDFGKLLFDNNQDAPSHLTHVKLQYDLTTPMPIRVAHQKSHERVSQNACSQRTVYMTERIGTFTWNMMRKWIQNKQTVFLPNSTVQNTINVTTRKLTVMTITDLKLSIYPGIFDGLHTYNFQKSQERVTEQIWSNLQISSYLFGNFPRRPTPLILTLNCFNTQSLKLMS